MAGFVKGSLRRFFDFAKFFFENAAVLMENILYSKGFLVDLHAKYWYH